MNYYVNLLIVECCQLFLAKFDFFGIDYRLNERFTDRTSLSVVHSYFRTYYSFVVNSLFLQVPLVFAIPASF